MICGHCKAPAVEIATVKACSVGEAFPCHWMVEYPGQTIEVDHGDGEWGLDWIEGGVKDCGAHAIVTPTGWACEAGHEHVNVESRVAQGWDYAEEYGEAMDLARAGVEPRTMSGHAVTGPEVFA